MKKQIKIPFQVTLWDLEPYSEIPDSPTLMQGVVNKVFDGEMKGESSGKILMFKAADGSAAYTVLDRFEVEIDGKKGSFAVIHGATHSPTETSRAVGSILPNSGTGELAGISGGIEFTQGESGKQITLDFSFED